MIDVMEKEKTSSYLADFAAFEESATARSLPSWIPPLRRAALSRFSEMGFPTRRDEEWRFTNVAPIERVPFQRAGAGRNALLSDRIAGFTFDGLQAATQLVFVNGHYAPELSTFQTLPQGVTVSSLAKALRDDAALVEPHLARVAGFEHQAFTALNTAFLSDGAFVHIGRGRIVEEPIHLLFVSTSTGGDEPTVSHPRTLIVADENSQTTIIESYAGWDGDVYFTNAVTEVVAAENTVVDHYKLLRESDTAFHIANMQIRLARTSSFSSHSLMLGGAIVRNDVGAHLGGEGIECTLNGLYMGTGDQLIDNHTTIDHAMPHCNSHEVYKGILDGKARGVFNGKIFVQLDAQKTDAKQTNKALLLSDDAQINTKPQLEIFADDVKCTHGATIGQLDENAIFYLRSRGIGAQEARSLLVYAFAGDIIDRIKIEPVRAQLQKSLFAQLAKGPGAEEAV